MADSPLLDDIAALTRKYYHRLRELAEQIPDGRLEWRPNADSMPALGQLRHVVETDFWYLSRMGVDAGPAPEPGEVSANGVRAWLETAETGVVSALEGLADGELDRLCEVGTWWADGEVTARLVLMQSLAHKYYHCGQLQALAYAIEAE